LETILVLEFTPGERDFLQDLQIILEIPESGLLPCLLPTLSMSLAAAFAISMSLEILLERVSDSSDIASAASDFLLREVLDRLCPLLEISIPHSLEAIDLPTSSIGKSPSIRMSKPLSEYQSASGAVCS